MIFGDSNITLEVNDHFNIYDATGLAKKLDRPYLRGHVIIRDPITGEILREKDNLILLRSRAYVLELLFNMTVNTNTGYNSTHGRTVEIFKIGNGASDLTSDPLNVIAPKFNNTDLYNPIPFVIEDPNVSIDPEKRANPSFIKKLSEEQINTYYLPEDHPDGSIRYYGKRYEDNSNRLVVNSTINQCYWTANLLIDKIDARAQTINELGLLLSSYDEDKNTFSNIELFSHITFESISLKSLKRSLLVNYAVYA